MLVDCSCDDGDSDEQKTKGFYMLSLFNLFYSVVYMLFSLTISIKSFTSFICERLFLTQFVADGVFFAELNEVLTRELAEDGYSGVEVRVTPMRTEIIIRATRTQNVLG